METRILLISDLHLCHVDWQGMTSEARMALMAEQVNAYTDAHPTDAILMLGDFSLDFWQWQIGGSYLADPPVSNTKRFVDEFVSRLRVPCYLIPGNHEQYGNATWKAITGCDRQFALKIGDLRVLMLDTFAANLDPTEHSDGTYCGADVAEIRALMSRYPNKKVILCVHWFDMDMESEDFRELLRNEDRILCLFCGHNHRSAVANTGEDAGNKPIGYTGQYSYSNEPNTVRSLHGYRLLEFDEKGLSCRYIVHPHRYRIGDVYFTNEYSEQDKLEISF